MKPRPGVFPSSEEIERQHHNQLDPGKIYMILIVLSEFALDHIVQLILEKFKEFCTYLEVNDFHARHSL